MRFQKIRTKHLNFLTRRHLMTLIYKYADAVEEVAVGTLSTLAVLAIPVLIIIASV